MNKKEAIQAMLDGEKVTVPLWSKGTYAYCQKSTLDFLINNSRGVRGLNLNGILKEGWEIYKEPKKKVKLWRFVINTGEVTTYFYTEDLISYWKNGGLQKHGDYTNDWIKTSSYIEVEI